MLKALRRVRDYVKYDLKEIIVPSSLSYPPGEEELHRHKRLTWKVRFPCSPLSSSLLSML